MKIEPINITATCSCCGKSETVTLEGNTALNLIKYNMYGRSARFLQDLFPDVPGWIRSGAIDKYSGGFCICPECCG